MSARFVAASPLVAALLAIATIAVNAQPAPPRPAAAHSGPAPAIARASPTPVGALHLTPAQRRQIRSIIAGGRRDGVPTLVTRRKVFRVLTPAQRESIERLVSRPARPL